ncbi:hypothetical protein SNE40_023532 [Patella caerulea]|uniref:ATP-dependent RNA helicase DDX42 n=1 Tax=Patella caerulea TaxID=87958 RepID=A0AAN8G3D2_PATCE
MNSRTDSKKRGIGFGGFAIKKKEEPQQLAPSTNFSSLSGMGGSKANRLNPGRSLSYSLNIGKKRVKCEDDYFDDEDEDGPPVAHDDDSGEEFTPAGMDATKNDDSDSDDPLDAFMEGVEKELTEAERQAFEDDIKEEKEKGVRNDIDDEDVQEAYFRFMEENPNVGVIQDDDDDYDYDSDGNVIPRERSKIIDPLPPIDHSDYCYQPFERNFYNEHEEIKALTSEQVNELRNKLSIKVSGLEPSKPVCSFGHFGFDEVLLAAIRKSEYTKPTPIQAQAIPVALSGRDIIGIAKTGSGKTAAFLWPMLIHIMDQKELEPGEGPIGLILAPTRELSQQIYQEAKKFGKIYNINVVCAYGGGSMWEQTKACQEGAEIIVATPGRLIDLIKKKSTNLERVTYLVFDEADRMFDMGFEPQVRSIANHVRPTRQTLLFSATFRKRIEKLARDILGDPVRIVQGEIGEANEDVTQYIEVLPPGPAKWSWLVKRIVGFTTDGSVLIFVTRKSNSEELAANLRARDLSLGLLHGDISQSERNEIISSFKKKEFPILVATDVAARGLDIPHIKTVVNYDIARDIDTHTHRIGRTGRAGEKGTAYTLITNKDKEFAPLLVRNLEGANQFVPPSLLDLAVQCPWFNKNRYKKERGKSIIRGGGKGLGFKERPGLGSESSTSSQDSSSLTTYRPSASMGRSDRLTAMKAALTAQFKSNFVTSTTDGVPSLMGGGLGQKATFHEPLNPQAPNSSDSKRRKKSRWD